MVNLKVRSIYLIGFTCLVSAISLLITLGCQTTSTYQVPYKKERSKYIKDLAILYPAEIPEMSVNIRSDEQFLTRLLTGPAIIPQIMLQLAFLSTREEDAMIFNDMIFDLNIGEIFCERLNTKLQLCSYLHVVPQEGITKNKVVWKLLEKKNKSIKDYQAIGTELGTDTLLEINVISYGIKDPGIFSDPYAILKVEVKMTTASEGKVLWNDIIEARSRIEMDTIDFVDTVYGDVHLLKEELEKAVDIVSEECVERLGFDTHNTYLLDKDYLEDTRNKIDIAQKFNELNNLRYESLITDNDYEEKKLDLVERAKSRKNNHHVNTKINTVSDRNNEPIIVKEKTKSGLPPLPRRNTDYREF